MACLSVIFCVLRLSSLPEQVCGDLLTLAGVRGTAAGEESGDLVDPAGDAGG